MREDLIQKAKELNIDLRRPDIKSIGLKYGITVAEIKKFLEGFDDDLALEFDYMIDSCCSSTLDYCELYSHVWVTKDEEELEKEIQWKLNLIERNKQEAIKNLEVIKNQELARINSLELELNSLKKKHGL